jgi:hypothetical protein
MPPRAPKVGLDRLLVEFDPPRVLEDLIPLSITVPAPVLTIEIRVRRMNEPTCSVGFVDKLVRGKGIIAIAHGSYRGDEDD